MVVFYRRCFNVPRFDTEWRWTLCLPVHNGGTGRQSCARYSRPSHLRIMHAYNPPRRCSLDGSILSEARIRCSFCLLLCLRAFEQCMQQCMRPVGSLIVRRLNAHSFLLTQLDTWMASMVLQPGDGSLSTPDY
jgi:hypothetical protein